MQQIDLRDSPHPAAVADVEDAQRGVRQLDAALDKRLGPEPEWRWRSDAVRPYCAYWCRLAVAYARDRLSPARIRADWTATHTHILLQVVYTIATLLLFILLFYFHGFAATVPGYGQPQDITCHNIAWGGCGLNAGDCQPFETNSWQALRCPHRCTLLSTKNTVTGGGADAIYKATSHICNSALHAGLMSDQTGGCFLYRPSGIQTFFDGGTSHNGITSQAFPSWFPGSMQLRSVDSHYCKNYGVAIIVVAAVWFLALACMRPHGMLLWFLLCYFGYWYIALTLKDNDTPINIWWQGTLNCMILGVFGYVLYRTAPQFALYVPLDYEERSRREFPWRLFFRGRKRAESLSSVETARREHAPEDGPSGQEDVAQEHVLVSGDPADEGVFMLSTPSSPAILDSTVAAAAASNEVAPDAEPMGFSTAASSSSLGSRLAAVQSHERDVHTPLIPAAAPSASPSVPSADASTVRRRLAQPSSVDDVGSKVVLSAASSTSPSPSQPAALVLRPWYDLYFLYTIPFLLSLHFSYIAYIPSANIDLDSTFFSHGAGGIAVIIFFIVVVLAVVLYTMKLAFRVNLLFRYLLYYGYVVAVVVIVSGLFHATASFHLHHVQAGILLIPMSRFNSRISLIFQAVVTAIFLNGLALWNFSVAWDVSTAGSPYNSYNAGPQLSFVQNATASTAVLSWPVYSNRSDAIGTTLFINDIEILHTTYSDLIYGGGSTPYAPEVAVLSRSLTPAVRRFDSNSRPIARSNSDQHVLLTPYASSTAAVSSRKRQRVKRVPVSSSDATIALQRPFSRIFSSVQLGPAALASVTSRALSTVTLGGNGSGGSVNNTGELFVFELTYLLPNTTYELQAGYILPGITYSFGQPLLVTTNDTPP